MNTFRKIITVCICGASLLAPGCTKPSELAPTTETVDVGPTYVAPNGTGAQTIDGVRYEYVATAEREAQIVAGFPKLRLDQSREEVRDVLGLPDTAQPGYSKAYNSQFLGWGYKYRIKMREGSPNMNDVVVEVYFNRAGKLMWAVPNHIAGLTEVGGRAGP